MSETRIPGDNYCRSIIAQPHRMLKKSPLAPQNNNEQSVS